jgi:hypothetical protein
MIGMGRGMMGELLREQMGNTYGLAVEWSGQTLQMYKYVAVTIAFEILRQAGLMFRSRA